MTFSPDLDRTVETTDGERFHLGALATFLGELGWVPARILPEVEAKIGRPLGQTINTTTSAGAQTLSAADWATIEDNAKPSRPHLKLV